MTLLGDTYFTTLLNGTAVVPLNLPANCLIVCSKCSTALVRMYEYARIHVLNGVREVMGHKRYTSCSCKLKTNVKIVIK